MTTIAISKARLDELTAQLIKDMGKQGITVSPDLARRMALPVAVDEQKKVIASIRAALGSLGDAEQ